MECWNIAVQHSITPTGQTFDRISQENLTSSQSGECAHPGYAGVSQLERENRRAPIAV